MIQGLGRILRKGERMNGAKMYRLDEALRALGGLREAAGLGPEMFPVQAFVGMISDEVEALREQGRSDEEIVGLIAASSGIGLSPDELRENFASAEKRGGQRTAVEGR